MNKSRAVATVAVVLGAIALTVAFQRAALQEAQQYSMRTDMQVATFFGLFLSYLAVASACTWLLSLASGIARRGVRVGALVAAAIIGAALLHMAPLLAFLTLAGLCQVQFLCPDYANPMGWALSGAVWSPEKPFAAAWLAPLLAAVVLYRRKSTGRCSEA